MPLMPTIISGPDLTNGLRNTFVDVYKTTAMQHKLLPSVMDLSLPSDSRQEIYSYPETAPYPERWDYGTGIPGGALAYKQFTVPNIRYGKRIAWEVDDREDGKTQS